MKQELAKIIRISKHTKQLEQFALFSSFQILIIKSSFKKKEINLNSKISIKRDDQN